MTCCNHNCRQGRDCPSRIYIRGVAIPAWVLVILFLVLFGAVGHMDFVDNVRYEYQHKCQNGTIDVEGDIVICTIENQKPFIIGELK